MSNIAYVVAVWGDRTDRNGNSFLNYILESHAKALLKHNIDELTDLIIVINSVEAETIDSKLSKFKQSAEFKKLESKIKIEFIIRKNFGFSYGAWSEGLKSLLNSNVEYAMLIEDDYIPAQENFLEIFKKHISPDTAFVCQKAEDIPNVAPRHAAVSNGLINMKALRAVNETYMQMFSIFPFELGRAEHLMGTENQITFLALLESIGYKVKDISDDFSVLYFHSESAQIRERGNMNSLSPLIPLELRV